MGHKLRRTLLEFDWHPRPGSLYRARTARRLTVWQRRPMHSAIIGICPDPICTKRSNWSCAVIDCLHLKPREHARVPPSAGKREVPVVNTHPTGIARENGRAPTMTHNRADRCTPPDVSAARAPPRRRRRVEGLFGGSFPIHRYRPQREVESGLPRGRTLAGQSYETGCREVIATTKEHFMHELAHRESSTTLFTGAWCRISWQ